MNPELARRVAQLALEHCEVPQSTTARPSLSLTAHPTAAWTRQQLREALGFDPAYHYLIHDRDSIFSAEVDA